MKKHLCGICTLLVVLYSCNHSDTNLNIQKIDSVAFNEVPYNTLSCYDNPFLNGEHLIAINNSKKGSIVLFNNTGSNVATISYAGVHGLSETSLQGFELINYDSIFLHFSDQIAIIDSAGNLKYALAVNEFNTDNDTIVIGNIGGVGKIIWSENQQRLFVSQYSYTIGSDNPDYYNIPVLAALDIQSNKFNSISVHYPEMYKNDYYGDAMYCFNEKAKDDIVTVFLGTTDVEIYNTKTQKLTHLTHPKSKYDTVAIKPLDRKYKGMMDKIFEHLTISPLYTNIVYDAYNDMYYRFFVTSVNLKNDDGTYNGYSDKEYVLMLLDNDFNVKDEVLLGKGYLTYYSFVTKDGLYVMTNKHTKTNNENHTSFNFDVFKPVSAK